MLSKEQFITAHLESAASVVGGNDQRGVAAVSLRLDVSSEAAVGDGVGAVEGEFSHGVVLGDESSNLKEVTELGVVLPFP